MGIGEQHGLERPTSEDLPHRAEQECGVVQPIEHDEPPAVRDPLLLNLQADEDWASSVEMRLHGGCAVPEPSEEDYAEDVLLLQFNTHPHEFKESLLDGLPLRACRDELVAE